MALRNKLGKIPFSCDFLLIACIWYNHGVQRRMISVVNFHHIFEIFIFCFVVAICDLVHAVEAIYGLP